MKKKHKNFFAVFLITVALLFTVVGILDDQVKMVFIKAANI